MTSMHVTLMRVPADGRKQGGTTDYELRPYAGRSFCFLRESTKPCEGKSTGLCVCLHTYRDMSFWLHRAGARDRGNAERFRGARLGRYRLPCEGKSTGLSRMLAYNHMEGEDYEREIAGNQRRSNETDPAV